MRITAANGAKVASAPTSAQRSAGSAFTLSEPETPAGAAASTPLRMISGIEGLMALQGIEGAAERKKRAVAKGRKALDVLDNLKLALLDGSVDPSALACLKVASEGLDEETGDAGLDDVMGEISLRVEVELAKAGIR